MSYYYSQNYCKAITDFLPGYSDIVRSVVGYRHLCFGTIVVFISVSILFYFGAKMIIKILFRFVDLQDDLVNSISIVMGFISAFLLGEYAYLIFNPLVILIIAILLMFAIIRALLVYLRGGYRL